MTEEAKPEKGVEELREVFRERINYATDLYISHIAMFTKMWEEFKGYGVHKHDHFFNLLLNCIITSADQNILMEKVKFSEREYDKILFSRMLAIILIEHLYDINFSLGKQLKDELTANGYLNLVDIVKQINKDFIKIKDKHQKTLDYIRNNLAAHKTKNSIELLNGLNSMDPEDIISLNMEISDVNVSLINAMTAIMSEISKEARSEIARIKALN